MTDLADTAGFDAALAEALRSARTLRQGAERLSASLGADTPEVIRASTQTFEGEADAARPVFDRLLEILSNANHHTLESAFLVLAANPRHVADAARMQALISEFRRTGAVISRAERRINDALLAGDGTAPPFATLRDEDGGIHAQA